MYDRTQFVVLKQDLYSCRLTNLILINREKMVWNLCSRVSIYNTMKNKQLQQKQPINKLLSYAR